jgi:hypothetical protein
MRHGKNATLVVLTLFNVLVGARAQTAATATVSGTVSDPRGAVVAGAVIRLVDTATNQERKSTANDAGQYQFLAVQPGVYSLSVTMAGFQQGFVPNVKVDVSKAHEYNFYLEVGQVTEKVEVKPGVSTELQKLDATVGSVIGGVALKLLPSLSRDAAALLSFQPMATPPGGGRGGRGGQVAGARVDQNTFMLDGGDATSNTEGADWTIFTGVPRAAVPTPAESLEEFRVNTNNPNATFNRSAGAQVNMVTKRGANLLHGSAYWYHQNDNFNANTWVRNRLGQPDPELKDNRFGLSLGGPIIKDETFIFGHYEGRRFPQYGDIFRLVPTDTLRAGVLRFRDAAGNIQRFSLTDSTACGPSNSSPCDPRGKGISPVSQAVWKLLPSGNDPSLGDGLNTIGFRAAAPFSLTDDFGVARLDHQFDDKWQFMTSYRHARTLRPTLDQINIAGARAVQTSNRPLQPRYLVAGLTGQITPRFTNDFRFNWLRHWLEVQTQRPAPQVPGTAAAVQFVGESPTSSLVPINIDTLNARSSYWNGRDYTFQDNLSWANGEHTYQLGARYTHQNIIHQRDDKLGGGLTSLVYQVTKGSNVVIPGANRPPTCAAGTTTNCIQAGDIARWNTLYAATLGIVDRATVITTRNGKLELNPLDTPLRDQVKVNAFELFANDIWRLRPSLTFSYGMTYNVQLPPGELEGKQTLMIDTATKEVLDTRTYLKRRLEAAREGDVYNPQIGFLPIKETGRKYPYDPDWNNLGPRIAVAWNPSFKDGFLGKVFGDRTSVFRGGYGLVYDRMNARILVIIPLLGYAQTLTCQGPSVDGQCLGSGGTNPSTAFRVGIDGSAVPLPTVGPTVLPIIPTVNSSFELSNSQIDPKRQIAASHGWDFTIQREMRSGMLFEIGYVGRISHGLYQGLDLNSTPFFMQDPKSGQTFAQAYDAVADAVRTGGKVPVQAWFENMLKGASFCSPNCTAGLAAQQADAFQTGNVFGLWRFFNKSLVTGPAINEQAEKLFMVTDFGRSEYHAMFATLTKRLSHGLIAVVNYTLSRSRDQVGLSQDVLNSASNPYNLDFDFAASNFDRRHTLNGYWYYQLPTGRSDRHWLNNLLGGWYTSGSFNYASGLPRDFTQGTCSEFGQGISGNCDAVVPRGKPLAFSVHQGVVGSGGVGTNAAGKGTGLNVFANPEAVYKSFRRIRISEDTNQQRGAIRGLSRRNIDVSIGKETRVTERIGTRFSADFTNVFNWVEYDDPSLNLTDPAGFGVLTSQINRPRFIQLGFRVEW